MLCKGVPTRVLHQALAIVQSLEPIGIGATSLNECLLIQLEHHDAPELAKKLILYNLRDLASGRVTKISSHLGTTLKEVKEALQYIRRCHPRPGSIFCYEVSPYIYPDIIIQRAGGNFEVHLNEELLPELKMNDTYCKRELRSREERVRVWHQSASWLLRGLAQRRNTIKRIAEKVMEKQRPYFDQKEASLCPLTRREVAYLLGMHESTVSRAIQHKYVETPRGTVPFSFFFSKGLGTNNEVSTQCVKESIKQFIQEEDKSKPYSDQQLTHFLRREGVHISRRTVMKYREELEILSSTKRRLLS
jgi:RNA polymerase sigma-54 factor